MPGMDWELAAAGAVSAVATRRVLINIVYPIVRVRPRSSTRDDARGPRWSGAVGDGRGGVHPDVSGYRGWAGA